MAEKLAPTARHELVHQGRVVLEWDQTVEEVNLYVPLPPGARARQVFCDIAPRSIAVGLKGASSRYLDHVLEAAVKSSESFWTIEDGVLHVTLQKVEKAHSWTSPLAGQGQLDPYSADMEKRRLLLERFQLEHPGFDFSGANVNGACPDPDQFMGGLGGHVE
eukprot:SM000023S07659  [mRNA]  locus=s23:774412:775853:+ [translate_table: standard]